MTPKATSEALAGLSVEEIEQVLASAKKQEKDKRVKEQKAYEKTKDNHVELLMAEAKEIALLMTRFKAKVHAIMDVQAEKLAQYGKIRTSSKGGFQVTHSDGTQRIVRRRDTMPVWDEKATKGVELIKAFLGDVIKKRDVELYEILIKFLEKNKKGDMEYAKVFELLEHEDKFTDQRWLEGLRLLKESFKSGFKGYAYEFKTLAASGKFESLALNFYNL